MAERFAQLYKLIADWKSFQPINDDARKKLDKKFRLEFNYNSNHIEGNTLTYGETELLLLFDDTKGNHTMREYEEMKNHDVAWKMVEDWAKDKEQILTEKFIKNLNEVILVRPFWKEAITIDRQSTRRLIQIGDYKKQPNSVRLANGEMFEYASPTDTPILMHELVEWYRKEENNFHPLALAAHLHYRFVRIHPFDDGNGRIARLLMNYVLLKNDLPPIIIKSADKASYLRALHEADIGNFEAFENYLQEQFMWSLGLSIKAVKEENIEEEDDWQKRLHLLKNKTGTLNEVSIKKGPEAYKLALKNIILPFINSWEATLQNIESLFYSRKCQLNLNDNEVVVKDNDLISMIRKCFDEKGTLLLTPTSSELVSMKIVVGFTDLRSNNIRGAYNGGEATIKFYDNALSISIVTNRTISKLYSELLTDGEAKSLANELGNWVMNHLEEFINSNPKSK